MKGWRCVPNQVEVQGREDGNEVTRFRRCRPYQTVIQGDSAIPGGRAPGATTLTIARDCNRPIDERKELPTVEVLSEAVKQHQQNVKTSPGPPRGVMVPLVLLVHPDPPWSTFVVKFQKGWIRMDRSGPGGPQGPQPPLVDQERSGPPWTSHQKRGKGVGVDDKFSWC